MGAILEDGYCFLASMLFADFLEKYGFCFVWIFLIVTMGVNVFSSSIFYPDKEVPPMLEF